MSERGVFIGKLIIPRDREFYEIRNPADTRQVVAKFPRLRRDDAREAIGVAKEAFAKWGKTLPVERARILYKVADIIESRADEMARTLTLEEGKTLPDSMFEVVRTVNLLRFYAGLITRGQGKVISSQDRNTIIMTTREPLGVISVITPWNFPLSLPAWKIIPAIATGNTVVWKPASITPTIAYELVKAFYDAGLPEGVLNLVTGSASEVGDELVTNKDVDAITFTGSLQTGKEINEKVGRMNRFIRVQLELGGKNATVLSKNGDINLAVELTARSAFGLTGQACTATSRFLVPEDMHDEVLSKLIERTKKIVVGNGLKSGVDMGPLASKEQYDKILSYIEIGRNEGAKLVYGGQPIKGSEEFDHGYFVMPTIFDGVTPDMRIAKEEIFGPVLAVMTYRTLDEAIDIVNSTEYGLIAGIVTRDISEAAKFTEGVKVGVVKVNKPTIGLEPWVPYGGVKGSGNDMYKEMGEEAVEFFTRIKAIYVGY
ncbi:aldehyde dehydrogenase family protein [Caldivirga maquilingensis]|uniref:Aldehyde dehydrogenase n=1 Tax=Caldivirga maquilingensis (strain ATCC 700844 / DSM 13496 / JCM 10307 / IC-167) TaxID=397948 RepID=A8MAX3_CALMQ|nr:aldehyde dehydrogenase family protein [Caldivirga maquilingensis]ABW02602.1 aldehyde dehydrogenase [Caldivirga maquilingensis IC-167]